MVFSHEKSSKKDLSNHLPSFFLNGPPFSKHFCTDKKKIQQAFQVNYRQQTEAERDDSLAALMIFSVKILKIYTSKASRSAYASIISLYMLQGSLLGARDIF